MNDALDRAMLVMKAAFDPQWGEAWTRRQLADSLAMPNIHLTLIDAGGTIGDDAEPAAGFSLVRSAPGEEELLLIAIAPEHRKRGLGRILLDEFARAANERGAERIFLEMRVNNPAISLYEAFGFEPIGRRRDYYRTPSGGRIDAVTYGYSIVGTGDK